MSSGIYRIINLVNGHQYIGSAQNLPQRWRQHRAALLRGDHGNLVLQRAWELHGEQAFEFKVILICAKHNLLMYEQRCIDGLQCVYNICKIAGSRMGTRYTDEQRANLAIALKNRPNTPAMLAHIEKLTELNRGRPGISHTLEVRERISAALKGRKGSAEASLKKSLATKGRPKSEEHKRKIGDGNRGKKKPPFSAEHRAKIGAAMKGRKVSAETRAKLAAAKTGTKLSPEIKARREAQRRLSQLDLDLP